VSKYGYEKSLIVLSHNTKSCQFFF